jgi:dTDP-4-amino-4,6-dideoxygalactose transaminase
MNELIRFNRPALVGHELDYVRQAVEDGHLSGDNRYTEACQERLQELLGVRKSLLTTSGTHALEMAALLLNVDADSEVIVPSFTFPSTAGAFALRGAKIVFADIRPDTLNLDERKLERLITPRTRAIVVVHYGGVGCEMDAILELAGRHGVAVVEDNAHGLFGKYRGRALGSFGGLACQSFHETKNISCGEGGALLINDDSLVERAEIIREKGTNRSSFFRGDVDKYSWVDIGSSYLPSDLLAAFLFAQLEAWEKVQTRRRAIWERYFEGLADWADANKVRLPTVPPHCAQSYHLFYLVLPTEAERDGLISHLSASNIRALFHYVPLHTSPKGRQLGGRVRDCPVTEEVSGRLIRLPFFYDLLEDQQERVIQSVKQFKLALGSVVA